MTERFEPGQRGAAWKERLVRSRAQITAGEALPLLNILDRLRASAERFEAEQDVTVGGEHRLR